MKPLYVSFFTERYRESAGELRKTLEAFGLEHHLADFSRFGDDWMKNVQRKPSFMLEMMALHPGRPLVWLDADARVRKAPTLFNELDCDFAAHRLGGTELLSGTMFFASTVAARRLVIAWMALQQTRPDLVDQVTLENLVTPAPRWLRIVSLPAAYVAIFDHPMCQPQDRVVEHLQHSRKYRFAG